MAEPITLTVDGQIYGGWTEVEVSRSLESMAGEFSLTLTSRWPDAKASPIRQGNACTVTIGDDRVLTGYVDDWMPSYDDKSVSINVGGRDRTADLVDCSVVHSSGQFVGLKLDAIARIVCQPFSIEVVVECSVGGAFGRVAIEQGESGFELLDRLAKQRGVLLTSNALGQLVITQASEQKLDVVLELGKNILAARGRFSWRDRASEYIVKGSGYGGGETWDYVAPAAIGGLKVVIKDPEITRYRPKIILSEDVMTAEGASLRGQWQRQRSLGQSNMTEITVAGWRIYGTTGPLWTTNKRVPVRDPIQGLDETWLINTVMFAEGDSGRVTVIGLVPPEAMQIPALERKGKKVKQEATWQ